MKDAIMPESESPDSRPSVRSPASEPSFRTDELELRPKLKFQCADRSITGNPDDSILTLARRQGIPLWSECGGKARCTTCRVRILDGVENVSPRTEAEERLAGLRNWDRSIRLACQTRVTGDVTLERLIRIGSDVSLLQVETLVAGRGDERSVAIVVCDVRNFTAFVEKHLSYDVVHILNKLFAALGEPIVLNNGVIYQYVGDEITGLFGLDRRAPADACRAAVRAGLGMIEALGQLNESLEVEFGVRLNVGIGIHYGPVIAGRIGHPSHQQFAVVGDTINVASRIQALNKTLGTTFLASESLVNTLPEGALSTGTKSSVPIQGREAPIVVYEIEGFTETDPVLVAQSTIETILARKEHFTESFYRRLFAKAPELRPLFPEDMEAQAAKLVQMLEVIVYALGRPGQLAMGLHSLAQRHVAYGVTADHYDLVRDPFVEAITEVLGEECTPEATNAWGSLVDTIVHVMKRGALSAAA